MGDNSTFYDSLQEAQQAAYLARQQRGYIEQQRLPSNLKVWVLAVEGAQGEMSARVQK